MVLFKGGYTDKQIAKIKESVEKLGGVLVEVNSAKEMTNYVNSKSTGSLEISLERSSDQVTNMSLFSHGVVGSIEFGHESKFADSYRLNSSNVSDFNSNAFSEGAEITSVACRSALGNSNIDIFSWGMPFEWPKYGNSIAAQIANQTGATVHAWAVRTVYANTIFSPLDRGLYPSNFPAQEEVDGAILAPNGANRGVHGGTTPLGIISTKMTFNGN